MHEKAGSISNHPGFVESLFFISSHNGARAQVFEMLPQLFRAFRGRAFLRGMVQPYFSVGSLGSRRGYKIRRLTQWASSFGISWCILSLVKKTLRCRRAGFEPQGISPFRKRVKAQKVLREAVRARTTIPHFVLLIILLVVLASSIGGDRLFLGIVSLCRPPPQDRGRARAAGSRFARDGKVPGPQLGAKQLPGERPRESAET